MEVVFLSRHVFSSRYKIHLFVLEDNEDFLSCDYIKIHIKYGLFLLLFYFMPLFILRIDVFYLSLHKNLLICLKLPPSSFMPIKLFYASSIYF